MKESSVECIGKCVYSKKGTVERLIYLGKTVWEKIE